MIKVFLREKKLKHNKRALYLDFYPAITHPETGKLTRREHLRLYVYERPKNDAEKNHNKETRILGANIAGKRQLEFQAGVYGFVAVRNKQKDFLKYFNSIVEKKKQQSKSTYENWLSVESYLKRFTNDNCSFGDVTEEFCRNFKEFLLEQEKLSHNSAASYFDKFKAAVRDAADAKLFTENPARNVKSIRLEDTHREVLTLEEFHRLAAVPYPDYEEMRRAALFSTLTGMAFAELEKLIWGEIQHSETSGYFIRFERQKTGGLNTLPISEDAFSLLGERGANGAKVFPNLVYFKIVYHLPKWISEAKINRKITFHSFRHSYATLQITLGTDLYTVSKLLGHKSIKTTQIYAQIVDEKKREAANKISLK